MEKRGKGRPPKLPEVVGRESPVAQEVRELRAALGWPRERLSTALGISFATIVRWETGRTVPKPDQVEQLRALVAAEGAPDTQEAA